MALASVSPTPCGPYDAAIAQPNPRPQVPSVVAASFPPLEGLRGLLAVAVVVFHVGYFAGFTWDVAATDHGLHGFLRHLDGAVPVFFVISAFLLYRPFVLSHLRVADGPDLRSYFARRLTRLFPAYWLALSVAIVAFDYAAEQGLWGKIRLYLLLQVYWADTASAGLPQAWSLNTEIAFYLVLPLVALVPRRFGRGRSGVIRAEFLLCLALGLAGVAFRVATTVTGPRHAQFWLPSNLDMFAIGMALAVVSATAASKRSSGPLPGPVRALADTPAMALAVAVSLFCLLVALDLPVLTVPTGSQELARRVVLGGVALCLVVPCVFGPLASGGYRRVLLWRPIRWAGTVSLGVYLWHITVLNRLDRRFQPEGTGQYWRSGGWFLLIVGLAVSVLIATVSWVLVERPLQRWVRKLGSSFRPMSPPN